MSSLLLKSSKGSNARNTNNQLIIIGLAAAASISLLLYYVSSSSSKTTTATTATKTKKLKSLDDDDEDKTTETKDGTSVKKTSASSTTVKKPLDDKEIHAKIEELDKIGKTYFKNKEYLEAAQAFTDALNFIEQHSQDASSASMVRQQITLLNNRSAMYEKNETTLELALDDCNRILEIEVTHTKARTRKLRIHEQLKQYKQALQEVCAAQLLFLQNNRTNLRLGLPVPQPPIPQSKMEEILNYLLPIETEKYIQKMQNNNTKRLPGSYTILQLLKSYTNYNKWMSQAAKDGSIDALTKQINDSKNTIDDKIKLLYKRGLRYVYERKYEKSSNDFEQAYKLAQDNNIDYKSDEIYVRLLEWTGMVRHWYYQLDNALQCLQKASTIEPKNTLLLVKQAGIHLDAGRTDDALKLFEQALSIEPNNVDALLHRSNVRIMQGKSELAKKDLEKCISIQPQHIMARLRFASILVPMDDMDGAKRQINMAEKYDTNSSDIHSYRGELYFAQGQMDLARREFELAIELEPTNPTPYVNCAMAIMNTPPTVPGQMPDTNLLFQLFEKAIEVDNQFAAAYIHLGQFKLGTATNLSTAREVIALYDTGLENCRSPEEIKEMCGMRLLAIAQVDAATALNMETFSMQ